ncbi:MULTISPECIES: nucleoside recognition domain-containing protein [unclassified Ruminococcus]|uniref:spore maturation protein n=1 Tax=unclassified Ruminococcus TaxID=2608920 RepID=UPI002109D04B|nr:spore maturation protein [Ruminococcus sp. zg-924]MCQ4115748.1 spore maturation protein [Ruminococcus sp. zg-921]
MNIGIYVIPVVLTIILAFGLIRRQPVFELFIKGARQGIASVFKIIPSIIALVCAVTMLRSSGLLDALINLVSPVLEPLGFPPQLLPLSLLRPVSGSGSLAVLSDIYKNFGADSFIGKAASVMMGSTETTFYAIAVYFGSVGISKTRHTVPAALMADFTGMVMAVLSTRLF